MSKKLQVTVSDEIANEIETISDRYGVGVSSYCAVILGKAMDSLRESVSRETYVKQIPYKPLLKIHYDDTDYYVKDYNAALDFLHLMGTDYLMVDDEMFSESEMEEFCDD